VEEKVNLPVGEKTIFFPQAGTKTPLAALKDFRR